MNSYFQNHLSMLHNREVSILSKNIYSYLQNNLSLLHNRKVSILRKKHEFLSSKSSIYASYREVSILSKNILTFKIIYICFIIGKWVLSVKTFLPSKSSISASSLHYRLRPIKRGQFRFANFALHFEGKMSLLLSNSFSFV